MLRILQISDSKELSRIMQDINVDPYGIQIMAPKGMSYTIRINSLPCIAANILKQEMLSLGADVAVAKNALTGKIKNTDCLLMGNLSQFQRLNTKLNQQPFGLNRLAEDISRALLNYKKNNFILDLSRYKIKLRLRPVIMGIVNLTPDSFSGNGFFQGLSPTDLRGTLSKGTVPERVIDFAKKMVADGADIIDIGGESSRPDAKPVSIKEELKRTIPIIKILAKRIKVPISIDTYKPQVAKEALDCGALIVNDITGLRNPKMRKLIAQYKAAAIIMHMKGNPRTMQKKPVYESLIDEILKYLNRSVELALFSGIAEDKIIIDPGIGFGKTVEHNLEIIQKLKEFKVLGYPILIGTSRKSFIGKILNAGLKERIFGTVSACVLAVKNGADMVRVHDVKAVKQALKIAQKINSL